MRHSWFLPLAIVLLGTSVASADVIPSGRKSVRLSIRVDAPGVPAGKVLVLAHTFRGADRIVPGQVAKVDWHPMGGAMQLVAVDSGAADKLAALQKDMNREAANAITDAGEKCGKPFQGVRTVPDTMTADEIRWVYRVSFSPQGCAADLVRTEYLAEDGTLVEAEGGDVPETPPSVSAEPSAPTPAPAPSQAAPPPAKSGCGACTATRAPLPLGAPLALFCAALAWALRRR